MDGMIDRSRFSPRTVVARLLRLSPARWPVHGLTLLFVLITFYTGLHLAYGTPMGDVADEPAHIARSAALLHGQIFGVRHATPRGADSGVLMDSGLAQAARAETITRQTRLTHPSGRISAAQVARARAISWSGQRIYVQASGAVEYFPAFYLPGALGIGIGALAGQRPLAALYTGRLFMLLSYIMLGAAALSLARFGRPLLFAILSLPMSVSLAASFNQDGQLIAAAALCGALLTWEPKAWPQARWIAAAIFAVFLCSKPPYGLLLFCAMLPLTRRGMLRRLLQLGCFGLPALIWVLVMLRFTFTPVRRKPYHPGPLWPGSRAMTLHAVDPTGGLRVLIAHPAQIFLLPYHDIIDNFGQFRIQFIGVLGWLNVSLPTDLYHDWSIALLAAALATLFARNASERTINWRLTNAILVLALVLTTIIAVELSLYLDWTNLGGGSIIGMQGRYFIVIVPFFLLALPRLGDSVNRWCHWRGAANAASLLLTVPAMLMALDGAWILPPLIARSFYQ